MPRPIGAGVIPLEERFSRWYIPEPNTGCWLWLGSLREGRAQFTSREVFGKHMPGNASIVSWFIEKGRMPEGFLCHTCDNPICVNPYHLYEGTPQTNVRDMRERGRMAVGFKLPHTKLSWTQVQEIRKLKNTSFSQRQVAKQFGLHQCHVSRIWKGERRIYPDR